MALQAYGGLAEVAVRCLCELLVALPHFNFHNNIVVVLAPLMNDSTKKVSLMGAAAQPSIVRRLHVLFVFQVSGVCCDAFRKLFQQDRAGGASLATVRVISGLVKSLNYNVRPEVTNETYLGHAHSEKTVDKLLIRRC